MSYDSPTKIVYLLGSDHSGSTLMGFLFSTHPELVSVGEACPPLDWFSPEYPCSCGETIRDCPFYSAVSHRVEAEGLGFSADNWDISFRYRNKFLNRALGIYPHHKLKRRLQHWSHRHLPLHRQRIERIKRVNDAYFRAALEVSGASVFCDTSKGQNRIFLLKEMEQLDIKLIWLVRDARAYIASCHKFALPSDVAAGQWLRYQEISAEIFASFAEDRRIQIKYEDLCKDPGSTMAKLYEYIGVSQQELPAVIDQKQHHVLGNKMRKGGALSIRFDESWRRRLSEEDLDIVQRIAGRQNAAFGYV